MPPTRINGASAFSLVELIVAISVSLIIGGAILSMIMRTYAVAEDVGCKTGALREMDDFDMAFSRDFMAAAHQLGFAGTPEECTFWTFRPASDDRLELVRVKYAIGAEGISSETWTLKDDPEKGGTALGFATVMPASFSYGDTNCVRGIWTTDWNSTSNAPVAISLKLNAHPPMPGERLYERRTP